MIINVGSRKSERNCFVPFFDGHGNRYHEFCVNECIFLLHCGVGAASLAALSESQGFPLRKLRSLVVMDSVRPGYMVLSFVQQKRDLIDGMT